MYRTLYSMMKPAVNSRFTGVMNIIHYSNKPGRIYFSSGAIISIKTNELRGAEAAEEIFSWVSFFVQFKEKKLKATSTPKNVEQTKMIMKHLARIDNQIMEIKNNIEGCETIFGIDSSLFNDGTNYTTDEKDIARAMDSTKTVLEICVNSPLHELDALSIISHFVEKGIATLISSHQLISGDKSKYFFKILIESLSDIIGPVAEVIVDEVCAAMGKARDDFCISDLGPLFTFIASMLEKEEKEAFDAKSIIEQAFKG